MKDKAPHQGYKEGMVPWRGIPSSRVLRGWRHFRRQFRNGEMDSFFRRVGFLGHRLRSYTSCTPIEQTTY